MALFKQLSREEIREHFTHTALFCGVVPVYMANPYSDAPDVATANWVPEFVMDLAEVMFGLVYEVCSFFDPDYAADYPFKITGEIK